MGIRMSAGRTALIGALVGGALLASGAPAVAADTNVLTTYAFGTCDTATGNWIVDWQFINNSDQTATIVNPVVKPAEYPIAGIPSTVEPHATVHATQNLIGTPGLTSSLYATVQWSDGSTSLLNWSFRPRTLCNKAA